MAIGTVDLNTLAYGSGGDLDGLTFILNIDGGGDKTVTFAAPANRGAVVTQINAVSGLSGVASIDGNNHLVITSSTTGGTSTIAVKAGTANAVLGYSDNTTFSGATTNGANGALGFDTAAANTSKVYKPASVAGSTAPQWSWAYSVNENMHLAFTWE